MSDNSVTLLKYRIGNKYYIEGADKWTYPDTTEEERLDKMIEHSAELEMAHGEKYKELWIKTCPIFATK